VVGDRGILNGDGGITDFFANDPLTDRIIACIIRVHQRLGPGFLEGVYKRALLIELERHGLTTRTGQEIPIFYDGRLIGRHRLDMLVEKKVIIELKAVEALGKSHYAQVRSYLKASGLRTAILVNFSSELADFRRIEVRR